MGTPTSSFLLRYGVGLLAVALTLGLKLLLVPLVEQETPFLLFVAPVLVAAWYGGLGPGLLATALAALASNFFFMVPFYRLELTHPVQRLRLLLFVCEGSFISLLCAHLQAAQRRAKASDEQARWLEQRVLEISEDEQRRIGHDLHDGLGQHLTGIAFKAKLLCQQLSARRSPEAADAEQIEKLVSQAIGQTRDLAGGLSPVTVEAGGLASALQQLAASTEVIFHISCTFSCPQPPVIDQATVATNLYRIAQEAVNNALKHGGAERIIIRLAAENGRVRLTVTDDGIGLEGKERQSAGLGLHTMSYRARMIGATLEIGDGQRGGTTVACECAGGHTSC